MNRTPGIFEFDGETGYSCDNEDGNYSCTCGPDSYKAGNGHCISTARSFTQPGYHRVSFEPNNKENKYSFCRAGMQANLRHEAAEALESSAANDGATADLVRVDATLSVTDEIQIETSLQLLTVGTLKLQLSKEYQLR